MAAAGSITIDVKVGADLEAAIRRIIRDEVRDIAQRGLDMEIDCTVEGCSAYATLATLSDAAYRSE